MSEGRENEQQFLGSIQPILNSLGKGARVYFVGDCRASSDWPIPFPAFNLLKPKSGTTGLRAVLHIFESEKRVSVSDGNRIIRIRMFGVPDALLRTRISEIRFSRSSQYNPILAIAAITHNRDVQTAMRQLQIATPTFPINSIIAEPAPNAAHIPAEMRDISLDEALDKIAIDFHGVVFYGVCKRLHLFEIYFDAGENFAENAGTRNAFPKPWREKLNTGTRNAFPKPWREKGHGRL